MYKTHITDLDLSTTPLTNGCRNDGVIQHGPLRSQSLFPFVQISEKYFEDFLLQYSPHCDQMDSNLANLEAAVKVE